MEIFMNNSIMSRLTLSFQSLYDVALSCFSVVCLSPLACLRLSILYVHESQCVVSSEHSDEQFSMTTGRIACIWLIFLEYYSTTIYKVQME